MAVAVDPHRRHVAHRPPWIRQREAESGAGLALGMIGMLAVGLVALVLSGQFVQVSIPGFIRHVIEPAQPSRPVEGIVAPTRFSAAALSTKSMDVTAADPADEAVAPVADPAPPALAVGARARVVNTDGVGVVLYAAPRANARQPAGLLEGTTVTVLELSDADWARVRSDSRQAGWVHASFLAPAN